jgi:hypothetical protein
MNEIPDLDSKIIIATQIDFFEKRYWEMIKELHAKNDMLEKQAKEIEQLKLNLRLVMLDNSSLRKELKDCTCQAGHSEVYLKESE